jgi:hypothetical protein
VIDLEGHVVAGVYLGLTRARAATCATLSRSSARRCAILLLRSPGSGADGHSSGTSSAGFCASSSLTVMDLTAPGTGRGRRFTSSAERSRAMIYLPHIN